MSGSIGKFRGPVTLPTGAGRALSQKPGGSSSSKKLQAQLTELERTKLEGDPLTLNGNSTDPGIWGSEPDHALSNAVSAGTRLILRHNRDEGRRDAIGIFPSGGMWFQSEGQVPGFSWYARGRLGSPSIQPLEIMRLSYSSSDPPDPRLLVGYFTGTLSGGVSTLDVFGSLSLRRRITTTSETVAEEDCMVIGDTNGGNVTLTLPSVSVSFGNDLRRRGRIYIFKKLVGINTLTIAASGADTIDGSSTRNITAANYVLAVIAGSNTWFALFSGVP